MPRKPNFTPKKKRSVHGATFWDTEYTNPSHLKLSDAESGDLVKFLRYLERRKRSDIVTLPASVLDAGCGNGRNLIFLAREYSLHGIGLDISSAAVAQARRISNTEHLPIEYHIQSAGAPLPAKDESQKLVLDMMTSHFLNASERIVLRDELWRVLEPGGFLFMKTFLLDDDRHSERLFKDHPGPEPQSYIHPVMGVPEYVYSEADLREFLEERFIVRQIYRSNRHRAKGGAAKRRTISVYAEKDYGRVQ
jgi:SAM-dependent methyltransferase